MFKLSKGNTIICGSLTKFDLGGADTYFYLDPNGRLEKNIEIRIPDPAKDLVATLKLMDLVKLRNSELILGIDEMGRTKINLGGGNNEIGPIGDGETLILIGTCIIKGTLKIFDPGSTTSYFPFINGLEVGIDSMPVAMMNTLKTLKLSDVRNCTVDFNLGQVILRENTGKTVVIKR